MAFEMTHDSLNDLACRWLKRAYSANGPGCHIALVEVGGLYGGERADAWGYRWGWDGGSVLVESKVSRSDFLVDAKKPHRSGEVLGMGVYRYYLCPEGIIKPEDLPERWGLLWVNGRGHIKVIQGHVTHLKTYKAREEVKQWQHQHNAALEMDVLSHTLSRVGDPQALNQRLREMQGALHKVRVELEELRKAKREFAHMKWKYDRLKESLNVS